VIADQLSGARTRLALVALAATNFVMVGIMAVAPVHMMMHGQGLQMIGAVIAFHVAGMFGPSPLSGRLADRRGPVFVVTLGGGLLLAASLLGILADGRGTAWLVCHLVVLGVGWNCGVVGGSTMLATAVPGALRPHVEAIGEVVMGAAAAVAAPIAGVVVAVRDYRTFAIIGAAVAAGLLGFALRFESERSDP
jgi:MFS family permease